MNKCPELDKKNLMKIVILVPLFPPKWLAGTELATYNIAKHLAKRGHDVHILTSWDKGLPNKTFEEGFFAYRLSWPKIRFIGVILFWVKMFLKIRKINPDLVHIQNIGSGIPGYFAKKIFKKPYLIWARGMDAYFPDWFTRLTSGFTLKNANAVIALTKNMKEEIKKSYKGKIYVIPNSIDLTGFNNISKSEMRKKLQINEEDKIILFVGRFRPEKGLEYLVKAISIIKEKDKEAKLLLVGEGPEEENLRNLVFEKQLTEFITFAGQIPHENVKDYMVASDIFVLPSLSEGFPNVLLEAMACGLSIVATRVTGIPEIVKDGENGFLVEPKDEKDISKKISDLLNNKELKKEISENNKIKIKEYTWDNTIGILEKVYLALLQNL